MTYEEIVYDVVDRVGTITLNRPAKLNAFTPRMMFELIDAFDQVDADDEVRAVIVTGAGRGFCAGADLGSGADTFNYEASSMSRWRFGSGSGNQRLAGRQPRCLA